MRNSTTTDPETWLDPHGDCLYRVTRVHPALCPGCRRYRRQVQFLRDALRRLEHAECGAGGGPTLPPEAREEILRTLGGDGPDA